MRNCVIICLLFVVQILSTQGQSGGKEEGKRGRKNEISRGGTINGRQGGGHGDDVGGRAGGGGRRDGKRGVVGGKKGGEGGNRGGEGGKRGEEFGRRGGKGRDRGGKGVRRINRRSEWKGSYRFEFGRGSRDCRECSELFIGDGLALCQDVYCYTGKDRPNLKNEKRCQRCMNRYHGYRGDDDDERGCRRLLCPEQIATPSVNTTSTSGQLDPTDPFEIAMAANILCSYCKEKMKADKGQKCLNKFGCLVNCDKTPNVPYCPKTG